MYDSYYITTDMRSTLIFAVQHDGTILYGVIQHLIYMYMLI